MATWFATCVRKQISTRLKGWSSRRPISNSSGTPFRLISGRNGVLGVLALGRREDHPFSRVDIGFLTQVANQVAIAVENATAYGQIEEARAELEKLSKKLGT